MGQWSKVKVYHRFTAQCSCGSSIRAIVKSEVEYLEIERLWLAYHSKESAHFPRNAVEARRVRDLVESPIVKKIASTKEKRNV